MPSEHAPLTRAALRLVLFLIALVLPSRAVDADLGDIVFERKSSVAEEYPPATFPHYLHRMQFKCHVCHDDIFPMRAGASGITITMDRIQAGQDCGTCHNGTIAFQATFNSCPLCHRP